MTAAADIDDSTKRKRFWVSLKNSEHCVGFTVSKCCNQRQDASVEKIAVIVETDEVTEQNPRALKNNDTGNTERTVLHRKGLKLKPCSCKNVFSGYGLVLTEEYSILSARSWLRNGNYIHIQLCALAAKMKTYDQVVKNLKKMEFVNRQHVWWNQSIDWISDKLIPKSQQLFTTSQTNVEKSPFQMSPKRLEISGNCRRNVGSKENHKKILASCSNTLKNNFTDFFLHIMKLVTRKRWLTDAWSPLCWSSCLRQTVESCCFTALQQHRSLAPGYSRKITRCRQFKAIPRTNKCRAGVTCPFWMHRSSSEMHFDL